MDATKPYKFIWSRDPLNLTIRTVGWHWLARGRHWEAPRGPPDAESDDDYGFINERIYQYYTSWQLSLWGK